MDRDVFVVFYSRSALKHAVGAPRKKGRSQGRSLLEDVLHRTAKGAPAIKCVACVVRGPKELTPVVVRGPKELTP